MGTMAAPELDTLLHTLTLWAFTKEWATPRLQICITALYNTMAVDY